MKFKYMIRGLGLGIIITAAVMGAYNRNAVADARVQVLKEYGLGEEPTVIGETETSEEETEASTVSETTEPVILRDETVEAEISSVLDAAVDAEQAATTEPDAEALVVETTMQTAEPEPDEQTMEEAEPQEPSTEAVVIVTPSDETVETGDAIQIVIAKGDDSGTVSRKLYNAGLIENAAEYDAFLMQHGYDKKISTGTKTIYATDSWQEIAEKLTRK